MARNDREQRRVQQVLQWGGSALVITGLSILLYFGYTNPDAQWTGFADYSPQGSSSPQFEREKTLWDWMQLLIIPAVLAGGAFLLSGAQRRNEQQIADDRAQESVLETYIDRMSELLLEEKLLAPEQISNNKIRDVARIRTLTALRRLDGFRKAILLQFLYESYLLEKDQPIIALTGADLRNAQLKLAKLGRTNLSRVDLNNANLEQARLIGSNLFGAGLRRARLEGANLEGVNLTRADLVEAQLVGARLRRAILKGADLTKANLSKAEVTIEQLASARSLQGAIMPDGSIHR